MNIPSSELPDAYDKAGIFLQSLHGLAFPWMHSATSQLPTYMAKFPDDFPVGVDLPTIEADFIDRSVGVIELSKRLKNRYRGFGEIVGRNNIVVVGEEIHDFLHSSAEVTEFYATHPLPEGTGIGFILPSPATLEYLQLTGVRGRSPSLEAFVRQQLALTTHAPEASVV